MAGFITRSVYQKEVEAKKQALRDIRTLLTTEDTEEMLRVKHKYLKQYQQEDEFRELIRGALLRAAEEQGDVREWSEKEDAVARQYLPEIDKYPNQTYTVTLRGEEVYQELGLDGATGSDRQITYKKQEEDGVMLWVPIRAFGAYQIKTCKCTAETGGETWCETCKGLK